MIPVSPLRYPGGKASLTGLLSDIIELNGLSSCKYFEPYAGGAGAALGLLRSGVVSDIHINDADPRIYSFWRSVLNETDRFVARILSVPLNLDEWHRQAAICKNPSAHKWFDVGFAAFYMNRCNRSGVLTGAGPIGGYEQNGKWKLDVRFNREGLVRRLISLKELRKSVVLTNQDALRFLKTSLPRGTERSQVFVYLDPPYVNKGQRLYLNAYIQRDHVKLARYMQSQSVLRWVMSYDDSQLVRSLYADQHMSILPIRYSLQKKRSASELLIAPKRLYLPSSCRNSEKTEFSSSSPGGYSE